MEKLRRFILIKKTTQYYGNSKNIKLIQKIKP